MTDRHTHARPVATEPLPRPDAVPTGRPRVFGVHATASWLSDDGSLVEGEIDVALLMTPIPGEPFSVRAPRGAISAGRLFVLRCTGLGDNRGVVARATDVSEATGLHSDLVSAELIQAPRDAVELAAADRPPVSSHRLVAGPSGRSRAGRPVVDGGSRDAEPPASRRASGSSIQVGGVATILTEVSMTLLGKVSMGDPVRLVAPRGDVVRGAFFSLRYFDSMGAKRALVRADEVRSQPGMLDEIEGYLIRPPSPAPERQAYRAPFERFFTGEIAAKDGSRRVRGRLIDLSASGVCFRVASEITPGALMRLTDPALGDLDGAELRIVRRDPRDPQRYGAAFLEEDRGASTVAEILGFDEAERQRRRRAEIESIRRLREATATPLTVEDSDRIANRGMRARRDGRP